MAVRALILCFFLFSGAVAHSQCYVDDSRSEIVDKNRTCNRYLNRLEDSALLYDHGDTSWVFLFTPYKVCYRQVMLLPMSAIEGFVTYFNQNLESVGENVWYNKKDDIDIWIRDIDYKGYFSLIMFHHPFTQK